MDAAARTQTRDTLIAGWDNSEVRFDHDLLVQARLSYGYSQREVARRSGICHLRYRRLELGGYHELLTLEVLFQLAGVLGLDPTDLIRKPVEETEPPSSDDLRLEALLSASPAAIPTRKVAQIFGWTMHRASTASSQLEARLEGTAIRLNRDGGLRLGTRPGILKKQEFSRASRHSWRGTGMTTKMAQQLRQSISSKIIRWPQRMSNAERVNMGRLFNQGLLERTSSGPAPIAAVLYSLGLSTATRNAWD